MAGALMESILAAITPDMKRALASRLGESHQGVQSGLDAATAVTLSGLDRKAANSAFLGQILGLLEGDAGQSVLRSLPSVAAKEPTGVTAARINRLLPMTFGTQTSQVANAIAQHAGLKAGSGLRLLKVAASLTFAYFAEVQRTGTLTGNALGDMLRAEASTLRNYLPARLLPGAPAEESPYAMRLSISDTRLWLVPLAIAVALLLGRLFVRSLRWRQLRATSPGPPGRHWAMYGKRSS